MTFFELHNQIFPILRAITDHKESAKDIDENFVNEEKQKVINILDTTSYKELELIKDNWIDFSRIFNLLFLHANYYLKYDFLLEYILKYFNRNAKFFLKDNNIINNNDNLLEILKINPYETLFEQLKIYLYFISCLNKSRIKSSYDIVSDIIVDSYKKLNKLKSKKIDDQIIFQITNGLLSLILIISMVNENKIKLLNTEKMNLLDLINKKVKKYEMSKKINNLIINIFNRVREYDKNIYT